MLKFIIPSLLLLLVSCSSKKTESLSLLVLIPFSGEAPRVGVACKIATDIIIDEVNARSDILPRYNIVALYRDESAASMLATKLTVEYKRMFETDLQPLLPSPILIGPFSSVGCRALAGMVHHLDMVMVAVGCASPAFTANRKLYPNLYKIRSSGELVAFPKLNFLRRIGLWNRIGILTFAPSLFDVAIATFLQKEAVSRNMTISFFDIVTDFDDLTMQNLVSSDTRIIVLDVIEPPLLFRFVCQAHKFGITGPRYVLILHLAGFVEPPSLPEVIMPGCSKAVYYEQMKISFWIAGLPESDQPSKKTSVGLSLAQFDEIVLKKANLTKPADYDKRTPCADAVLQGILALDSAERSLNQLNLSLKDYRTIPKAVSDVVNASVAKIQYVGFRMGEVRYSERLEFDYDPQIVMQWDPSDGKGHIRYRYQLRSNGSVYDYDSYMQEKIQDVKWQTSSGNPPRDSLVLISEVLNVRDEIFWTVVVLSSLTIIGQIFGFLRYLKYRITVEKAMFKHDPVAMFVLFLGLLFSDAAAIMFSAKTTDNPFAICVLRPVLISLSISFFHSFFFAKILLFGSLKRQYYMQRPNGIRINLQTAASNAAQTAVAVHQAPTLNPVEDRKMVKLASAIAVFLVLIVGGILTAWMTVDPALASFFDLTPQPIYNYKTDSSYSAQFLKCHSKYDTTWIFSIAGVVGALMVINSFMVFQLRNVAEVKATLEFKPIRWAVATQSSLFAAGLTLIAVLESSPISQQVTLSFMFLANGIITSFIVFMPMKLKNNV